MWGGDVQIAKVMLLKCLKVLFCVTINASMYNHACRSGDSATWGAELSPACPWNDPALGPTLWWFLNEHACCLSASAE